MAHKRILRRTLALAGCVGATLWLTACSPVDSGDRQGPREIVVERERVRPVRRAMAGANQEQIIQLVKSSAVTEGGPSTEQWLAGKVAERSLHVLFPRWDTERIAPQKYEVTYIYTEIGGDDSIQGRGYRWTIDAVLGLVSSVQELSVEDLAERAGGGAVPSSGEEPIRLE